MAKTKRVPSKRVEYERVISNIKGVDFSCDPEAISLGRLPVIENMYRNYSSPDGAILESIPGYRQIADLSGKRINSLFIQKVGDGDEYLLIHAGGDLYRVPIKERDKIGELTPIAALSDRRSAGFPYGDNFYIIDGKRITRIDNNGVAHTTSEAGGRYTPITYRDGEPVEQANLLGGEFIEEVTVKEPYRLCYGTPSVTYTVLSHTKKICAASGVEPGFSGVLYIPPYARIGNEVYTVTKIADHAFENNTAITSLIIASGPELIGRSAFAGCTNLQLASVPDTVVEIGERAFVGCEMLSEVYLGEGVARILDNAFGDCDIEELHYGSDEVDFNKIEGYANIPHSRINYLSSYGEIRVRIPLRTKAERINEVTLGDEAVDFITETSDGHLTSVIFSYPDMTSISNKTVRLRGEVSAKTAQYATHGQDVRELYAENLPVGCTVAQVFDGRIFLSGNPKAPGMIFFSGEKQRGADTGLYFGALDYLSAGSSSYKTRAMLAAQDTLAVFKGADGADGGIFYYKRIKLYDKVRTVGYEVSYVHNGIYANGDAIAFFDNLLFLSKKGLCGLDKNANGIGRNITCRSEKVNSRLLSEDISGIRMTSWCGYLVLAAENRIYLADSRATYSEKGGVGYEWFYLTGVGGRIDPTPIYRFSSIPYGDKYAVYHTPDVSVDKSADVYVIPHSADSALGICYYTEIDGRRYHVYKTEEYSCDALSPISAVASTEELLFFGTENGGLYLFNNDLISKIPESTPGASNDLTDLLGAGELHPEFYSFAGVWPRYSLGTGNDDLGVPYMTKSAVFGSLVLTLCARGSAMLGVYNGNVLHADDKDAAVGALNFYSLTFDNLTFETEARKKRVFRLRERGFAERDMRVICDRPRSPIGIYSIAYRYKICGRIKAR